MDWFSCFPSSKKQTVIQAHRNLDPNNLSKLYPKNEKQISIARATSQETKGQIQKQINRIRPLKQIPQAAEGRASINDLRQKTQPNMIFSKIQKSNYEEELQGCIKKKIQYVDPGFDYAITGPIKEYKRLKQIIPDAILMPDTISPNQITQGQLDNCYWLASIASLAEREYRIKNLFGTDKINQYGIYMCKLTFNGVYQQIVVDDMFPVDENGKLVLAKPYKEKYVWPMFLEKCWAKMFNSYSRTNYGYNIEALYALTHAPVKQYFFNEFQIDIDLKEQLFQTLLNYDQKQFVMVASIFDANHVAISFNLQCRHAYSVIGIYEVEFRGSKKRLVQIRNPYGSPDKVLAEPKLSYHSKNNFWKEISQQERNRLKYNLIQKADSGVFYLQWQNFTLAYNNMCVCMVNDNAHYIFDKVNDLKNGQPKYYMISVKNPQSFYALLVQNGRNKLLGVSKEKLIKQYPYSYLFALVGKISYDENNEPNDYQYVSSKIYSHLDETNYFEMDLKLKTTGDYIIRIIAQNSLQSVTPLTIGFYTPDEFSYREQKNIDDFNFFQRVLLDRARKIPSDSPDKTPLQNANGWMCSQYIIQSNICYFAFHVKADSKYSEYKMTVTLTKEERNQTYFLGVDRGKTVSASRNIERGHETIFIYSYKTVLCNPDVLPPDYRENRPRPQTKFEPIT